MLQILNCVNAQSLGTPNCPGCSAEREDEILYHMGTLVSDTYVLTAGEVFHLHKNPADWAVLPGASGLQGGQDFEVVLSWKFRNFSQAHHVVIDFKCNCASR